MILLFAMTVCLKIIFYSVKIAKLIFLSTLVQSYEKIRFNERNKSIIFIESL